MTNDGVKPPLPGRIAVAGDTLDPSLVARARFGDPIAFRQIFDRYARPVRRFLRDLLGDDAAADEATQETFVRAHHSLSLIRATDKLAPWLFGIARHVFHEQARARRRTIPMPEPDDGTNADGALDINPEALLLSREADELLAEALGELSEDRRTALLLRLDHGLGYDEIADVLAWPISKVKNEIHRARLQLRVKLTAYLSQSSSSEIRHA